MRLKTIHIECQQKNNAYIKKKKENNKNIIRINCNYKIVCRLVSISSTDHK